MRYFSYHTQNNVHCPADVYYSTTYAPDSSTSTPPPTQSPPVAETRYMRIGQFNLGSFINENFNAEVTAVEPETLITIRSNEENNMVLQAINKVWIVSSKSEIKLLLYFSILWEISGLDSGWMEIKGPTENMIETLNLLQLNNAQLCILDMEPRHSLKQFGIYIPLYVISPTKPGSFGLFYRTYW